MRMRKKKHLEERLGNISELLFISDLEDRNFNNAAENPEYIDFDKCHNSLIFFQTHY